MKTKPLRPRKGLWCEEISTGKRFYIKSTKPPYVDLSLTPNGPNMCTVSRKGFVARYEILNADPTLWVKAEIKRATEAARSPSYVCSRDPAHVVFAPRYRVCSVMLDARNRCGGTLIRGGVSGQSAALAADPPPWAPDYRKRLALLQAEIVALTVEAFEAGRARGGEYFSSRGVGTDVTPGCFVCGGARGYYANISGFVPCKAAGERVVAMFKAGARLDYRDREPDHVQVKIGACKAHVSNLECLHGATAVDCIITEERVAVASRIDTVVLP